MLQQSHGHTPLSGVQQKALALEDTLSHPCMATTSTPALHQETQSAPCK